MADYAAVARRFYDDVMSKGDLDALDEIIHDDFVEHEEMPGMPTGKEAPRAFVSMLRQSFPDFAATIEDMIQQGDKVVVRSRMSGTHQGDFMGIPASGRSVDVAAIDIVEFRDGKCVAHWGVTDVAAMMQQLGVIEAPGA